MAQKIILELKDKIKNQDIKPSNYSAAPIPEEDDTINALVALGYNQAEIITALRDVPQEYSVEEKIKYGLKNESHLSKQQHIDRVYNFVQNKFGKNGYVKYWLDIEDTKKEQEEVWNLLDNEPLCKQYIEGLFDEITKGKHK